MAFATLTSYVETYGIEAGKGLYTLEGGIYANVCICIKKRLQDFNVGHLATQRCRNVLCPKGDINKHM